MNCVNCSNEIKPTEKYCGRCGMLNPAYSETAEISNAEIPPENSAEFSENAENTEKEKKTAPLWLCILCIIIIFILSIACGALMQMQFGGEAAHIVQGVRLW